MPYTKIKHNKGTVTLTRVEDRSTTDSVEQTLTSHDDPRPEFATGLQALTSWVVRICQLPLDYADGMRITGVSLSAGEYGGVVVTALKSVDGATAPVVINTPHVPETPTSDAGPCLPRDTIQLLETLEVEADKFWRGERAQADMFDPPPAGGVTITEPYEPSAAEALVTDKAYQQRATANALELLDRHDSMAGARKSDIDVHQPLAKGDEATISINGGPDVPLSVVRLALKVLKERKP